MEDRELLERAASAAGIRLQWPPSWGQNMYAFDISDEESHKLWNPLVNDGDALRLAVKLSIEIYIDEGTATWCTEANEFRRRGITPVVESHVTGDHAQQCAATRRAIVCAAAAMVN